MSPSDLIALLQLILTLVVAVVGGTLAILGYLKIIKSADENAKERKEEIERNARERQQAIDKAGTDMQHLIQDSSQKLAVRARWNTFGMVALGAMLLLVYARNDWTRHVIEKG